MSRKQEKMKRLFNLLGVALIALCTFSCIENEEIPDYYELPYYCDLENFEGWSEARIFKDGHAIFTSNNTSTQQVEKSLMFVQADSLGFVSIYGEFDETGFPKSLAFNDAVVLIDNHSDTTFNATLFIEDTAVWTATDLELTTQVTRAWNENNWVRNTCAVGGVITSAIGIGAGVALTGTGIGTMTGLVTIATSCGALTENLSVLFGPAEESGGLSEDIEQYIQDKGWDSLCDSLTEHEEEFLNKWFKKNMDALDQLSWVDIALDLIDRKWGKTVTESQKRLALILAHRSYIVETGVAKDITEHTAELWGYVTPEALSPLGNYADIEYGIVVYPTSDPSNRIHKEHIVGNGGAFSLLFRGLEYNTQYSYFVYYSDKSNTLSRYGQVRTFKTGNEEEIRKVLIKLYHDTNGDNWVHNDNWCSDRPIEEWYGVEYDNLIMRHSYYWRDDQYVQTEKKYLELFLEGNNLVGNIDLSGCEFLGGLECYSNQLTAINVSGCTALKYFSCYSNRQLTSVIVSGCQDLVYLSCSSNDQLTSLDVSGCRSLEWMYCDYCDLLSSLNLSGCKNLKELHCYDSQLTSLNLSGLASLEYLSCHNCQLTSLNVSGCTALRCLWCQNNKLTSLDPTSCTALEELRCNDNPITQEITDFYYYLDGDGFNLRHRFVFVCDARYCYNVYKYKWYYRYEDHHGWYFPREPYPDDYTYGGVCSTPGCRH